MKAKKVKKIIKDYLPNKQKNMNSEKIYDEIRIQVGVFIGRFNEHPKTICISKTDFRTIKRELELNPLFKHKKNHIWYIYGMRLLRTKDLKSGEFKLSINLD